MSQQTTAPRERKPVPPHICGTCPATWTGLAPCHCSGCHQTFSGIRLFDTHRRVLRGVGICVAPTAIRISGEPLRLVDGVWRWPEMDDDARAQFAS